jgi:thiosulfate dehydrogenase
MRYWLIVLTFVVAFAALLLLREHPQMLANLDGEEFRTKGSVPLPVNLIDPTMAPEDIKAEVMRGFHIILETKKHLPNNVGNTMCCCHCHFAGGNTCGGINGGISLVGVTKVYPKTMPDGSTLTLQQRVNGCFMRSMNGRPIEREGADMKAIITYLTWISSVVESKEKITWLGLPKLTVNHVPNPVHGKELFKEYCSKCHGDHGQGQARDYALGYPALYGENSFNDAAGMNRMGTFSSFIYFNMPYQDPTLTQEQALDIASFVTSQERPHFVPPKQTP